MVKKTTCTSTSARPARPRPRPPACAWRPGGARQPLRGHGRRQTHLSRAFDNRIGCAVVIDVLRHFQNAPSQRSLWRADRHGRSRLRRATTSVRAVDPDVAIILEADIAGDVPGIKKEQSSVRLGGGPALSVFDARMIPNVALRHLVIDTAAAGHPLPVLQHARRLDRRRGHPPEQRRRADGGRRRYPRATSTATAPSSIAMITTMR